MDSKAPDAFRTISEVAADISVPQHVLRFWESRFREIRPMKRGGGRRYYRPDDIDLLRGIRHLLYGEGYTIKGVQRILKEQGLRFVQTVWQPGAPRPAHRPADEADATDEAEAGHDGSERGRGLFSLLPSLIGNVDEEDEEEEDDDDGEEPTVLPGSHQEARALAPSRTVPPVNGAAARPVPADQARKLQTALKELAECRKLIDAALEDKS